ncbi:MAG TPA: hypothetical protein VM823_12400 [Gaiellales bacterium]|nr:hypothetical protein [Gaiellales bacterium]
MTKWHPATKLLLLAALLVVPYLLWTSGEETAPAVAASVTRPESPAAVDPPASIDAGPAAFVLPPLEQLTAVVERPLFSPTRRMPVLTAAEETPTAPVEAPVEAAAGPAEPELRFFGTARQDGVAAALVTFPGTTKVGRLVPGDRVGEWQVLTVERDKLVLGLGDEQRKFEIFGTGARVAARPPAAAKAPPAARGARQRPARGAPRPPPHGAADSPPNDGAEPSPSDGAGSSPDPDVGGEYQTQDVGTPDDVPPDEPQDEASQP